MRRRRHHEGFRRRELTIVAVFFTHLDHPYGIFDGTCTGTPICHRGVDWWSLSAIPAFPLLALVAMRNYRARVSYWV